MDKRSIYSFIFRTMLSPLVAISFTLTNSARMVVGQCSKAVNGPLISLTNFLNKSLGFAAFLITTTLPISVTGLTRSFPILSYSRILWRKFMPAFAVGDRNVGNGDFGFVLTDTGTPSALPSSVCRVDVKVLARKRVSAFTQRLFYGFEQIVQCRANSLSDV